MSNDVAQEVSTLGHRLSDATDEKDRRELALRLIPLMDTYWDVHPHSAMEMLEYSVMRLDVSLANAFVRQIVSGWKKKASYRPDAGGSADHCYLSALILSENYDLADQPWAQRVLPRTLSKELDYPRFDRMRDAERRESIIKKLAASVGFVPRQNKQF